MDDDLRKSLDEWADQIASLEPEVRDCIVVRALRMAANRRLRKADRDSAEAQADAIGRALVRRKRKLPKRRTDRKG